MVPDPADVSAGYMVVYLVNDTDQPSKGVIGELFKPRSQVKVGEYWFFNQLPELGCGTVPVPRDLPPRHALALGAARLDKGDAPCEKRYEFLGIMSEPIPGKHFPAETEKAMRIYNPGLRCLVGCEKGLLDGDWKSSELACNAEEVVAILELARHADLCLGQRVLLQEAITEKLRRGTASGKEKTAIKAIQGILAKPWVIRGNFQSFSTRCLEALRESPEEPGYGSPEKFRAIVWRILASGPQLLNSFGFEEETRMADAETLAKLLVLAEHARLSGKDDESSSAMSFIASRPEAEVPAVRLMAILDTGDRRWTVAAFRGLVRRGKTLEAGNWLEKNAALDRKMTGDCYSSLASGLSGPEAQPWEFAILGRLLAEDPLDGLSLISSHSRRDVMSNAPESLKVLVRKALGEENTPARRKWWYAAAKDLPYEFTYYANRQALETGLRLLSRWEDPADNSLFLAYLDHPAAYYQESGKDGSFDVSFQVRGAARDALEARKVPIPVPPVLEATVPGPLPRSR